MLGSQKVLLVWGMILLFIALALSLFLGPKAATAPQQVKGAHGHVLCLAGLMLVMVVLQPLFKLTEVTKQVLAVLLGIGSTLLPVGVLIELACKPAGVAIAMINAILVVVAVFVWMIGALARVAQPEPGG